MGIGVAVPLRQLAWLAGRQPAPKLGSPLASGPRFRLPYLSSPRSTVSNAPVRASPGRSLRVLAMGSYKGLPGGLPKARGRPMAGDARLQVQKAKSTTEKAHCHSTTRGSPQWSLSCLAKLGKEVDALRGPLAMASECERVPLGLS